MFPKTLVLQSDVKVVAVNHASPRNIPTLSQPFGENTYWPQGVTNDCVRSPITQKALDALGFPA